MSSYKIHILIKVPSLVVKLDFLQKPFSRKVATKNDTHNFDFWQVFKPILIVEYRTGSKKLDNLKNNIDQPKTILDLFCF